MSDADHVLYNGNIHRKIVIVLCYSSVEMVIVAGWRQLGVGIEGNSSNNCLLAGIKLLPLIVGEYCGGKFFKGGNLTKVDFSSEKYFDFKQSSN